ncbi:MAG: methyltransferase domain-containing protein [Beijerinckiaceae bacterium]
MNQPAPSSLFDHALLRQRLTRRVVLQGNGLADGADFLLARAADDLMDRMAPILRPFESMLDFGTLTGHFGAALQSLRSEATVLHKRIHKADNHQSGLPEALDLPAETYALIASGLVLQHANDLPGVMVQLRRALKPDGLFIGCLMGGATLTELRQSLTQAESEITGGVSPRVFPFADVRDMGGLLQRAGFALPVADSEKVTVRYADIFRLMADLRSMGATNVLSERSRKFTPRSLMVRAAEIYAERFADPDGRIRATFEIIWLSGWAPHESQQKPLKPGSAKQRLADALGVAEKLV